MSVDLRTCKPGDKLLSCHGMILTYLEYRPTWFYPHVVEYPNGSQGTRTDDGQAFRKNKLPGDHDIVEIIKKMTNIETLKEKYQKEIENYSEQIRSYVSKCGSDDSDYLYGRREFLTYYRGAYNALIELERLGE